MSLIDKRKLRCEDYDIRMYARTVDYQTIALLLLLHVCDRRMLININASLSGNFGKRTAVGIGIKACLILHAQSCLHGERCIIFFDIGTRDMQIQIGLVFLLQFGYLYGITGKQHGIASFKAACYMVLLNNCFYGIQRFLICFIILPGKDTVIMLNQICIQQAVLHGQLSGISSAGTKA